MADIPPSGSAPFATLTPRERDVMDYVARGKPNKIIAAELGVSQRTIEAHRARIFQKMQVRNAVELVHCVLANAAEFKRIN
ncbi:helix-turn-helix transcriptional regulator [Alcaligenaceae bacterium]|nr:helix-turn-helix transcriptional regulator [Alcaligenaceae bacterium]